MEDLQEIHDELAELEGQMASSVSRTLSAVETIAREVVKKYGPCPATGMIRRRLLALREKVDAFEGD